MKIVIIGGVAGGATAAARLRRISEDVEILIVERGQFISFANCGLPYHIGGTIKDRDSLLVQTPERFKSRFNVNVKVKTEAIDINRENKTLILKDLKENREYEEKYDYLILSPGAEPITPPIEGIDSDNIFKLRNIPDMDKIISTINNKKPKRAVVVGGGFIGLEVAENLLERGIYVTLVEMADQILAPIDYEMAAMIHSHMKEKNIELYLKDGVEKFEDKDGKTVVYLKSGKRIKSDMVIMSIGVKPETSLAEKANLEIGERKGIVVDEYLKTKDNNIYAIGDAIEVKHYISNVNVLIPLAWPANRQGRIVADNILSDKKIAYNGSLGTAILKAFDLTAAATGLNEKSLKRNSIKYKSTITHSSSHAGYYPGAMPITIKLLYNDDGDILGAQVVGYDGVDKRIDVLATAIKSKLKIWDLPDLELAYAPPFGSAKDPVNIAGYVAVNNINGSMKVVHWNEIEKYTNDGAILLDVRTKEEFDLGTIKNAKHIPLDDLRENLTELDKDTTYLVFCQVGLRGYLAYRILVQNGFKAYNLTGGYKTYSYAIDKQENADIFDYEQIKPMHENQHDDVEIDTDKIKKIDARGLQCPGPIMQTYKALENMQDGEVIQIQASDPGFKKDVEKWAEKTGNRVLENKLEKGIITAILQKGQGVDTTINRDSNDKENKTIVVFSNDLDKAIASFIIANGAAAMGKKVTMFFTFWGLSLLRKCDPDNQDMNKTMIEKAFGKMLPKCSDSLSISKMNFGGMGTQMMKQVMKDKNVDTLEMLMKQAQEVGVNFLACQMSMDIMGIKREELIDNIEVGGVATYLAEAEDSNLNLFI